MDENVDDFYVATEVSIGIFVAEPCQYVQITGKTWRNIKLIMC